MKVWTTIRANALVAGDLMDYGMTQFLIEDIVVKDSDHLSVRFKAGGSLTVFWDEPVRVLREEPAPKPPGDQLSSGTSDKVKEALVYLDAMRRTGQGIGADVLDAAITALISDSLKTHDRARREAIQAARRRVEGIAPNGVTGTQMQEYVLSHLTAMEGPAL